MITGLLREEMGFDGLVIADDMEMEGINAQYEIPEAGVMAIEAGVDIVPCCHDTQRQLAVLEALSNAMDSGRISESRFQESAARIDAVFQRFVQ